MIKLSQVSKRYPNGHEALKDVSFDLASGEMAFLSGHSGAGKSTLFKLITRIEKPTSGQIIVDNQNLSRMKPSKVPGLRREIGVIFQDHKLLFDRSVFDNVALPLIVIGMPHDEIKKRVRAAFDFNRVGVTVLIATHDLRQVERLGKRTLILNNGRLITQDANNSGLGNNEAGQQQNGDRL